MTREEKDQFQGKLIIGFLLLLVAGFFGFFCYFSHITNTDWSETESLNVSRVMMHDQTYYTVFVEDTDTKEVAQYSFRGNVPKIFRDVEDADSMWIEYRTRTKNGNPFVQLVSIHIRQPADINGADWDHGKQGHGETVPLE